MADVWSGIVSAVLRPARKELAFCLAERDRHLEEKKRVADERARATRDCEARIERARARVFEASDGVVGMLMTDLEREWRLLSKRDPDGGLMDLWARITPASWHDVKRWRASSAASRVDAAVALASDVEGVEAAESAARALRSALRDAGGPIGASLAWRFTDHDRALASGLLRAAGVLAPKVRGDLHDALLASIPDRPLLARDIALVASVDAALPIPKALRALWRTGYALQAIGPEGITLEMPRL